MATARLVPSSYSVSNSNYVSFSDSSHPATNMYANTDSTTYATIRGRNSSNTSRVYYCYINGFDFTSTSVPSNATVSSFSIKIKAYKNSYQRTGETYRPKLASSASNSSVISNTTLSSDLTTTSGGTVYTFPNGSLTWNTLKNYGSNFTIVIPLCPSSNQYPYVYVYGAEIEVTYTAGNVAVTGVTLDKATDSVEVGSTTQLTATVAPSNATNQAVSWSSSNTSVATVNSSGVVTGVAAGSAVITVTTSDGNKTATCTVTVTQPTLVTYKLATSMQPGKSYLIANGNSGSVYLLSNEANGSRKLKGVAATVTNGKIQISTSVQAKTLFDVVLTVNGNSVTTGVMNDGKYLYCDNSSGLRMNTVATLDRWWHWNNTKFWQFKNSSSDGYDDTSSEYKYYLTLSGTDFTDAHVDTAGIENSTIPAIYLFEEDTGSSSSATIYIHYGGSWTQATTVYKKVSGSWVEQTDLTNVFDSNTNYKLKGQTATITASSSASDAPYVRLNGRNTYSPRTTARTFEFYPGDELYIVCYGSIGGGSIYIDGTRVASSYSSATYTYTLPSHDITITLDYSSDGRVTIVETT